MNDAQMDATVLRKLDRVRRGLDAAKRSLREAKSFLPTAAPPEQEAAGLPRASN